jgi:hypothetical protein
MALFGVRGEGFARTALTIDMILYRAGRLVHGQPSVRGEGVVPKRASTILKKFHLHFYCIRRSGRVHGSPFSYRQRGGSGVLTKRQRLDLNMKHGIPKRTGQEHRVVDCNCAACMLLV